MKPAEGAARWSIFAHTLLLMVATVFALAALNLGIILLRPPPHEPPLTAYEIARLSEGKPIAKDSSNLSISTALVPPIAMARTGIDPLIAAAIARYAGRSSDDVLFDRPERQHGRGAGPHDWVAESEQQYRLYAADAQFNPTIFGAYTAAIRQPDGRWRLVVRSEQDALAGWQSATIQWLIASFLLIIPLAWLFSNRIARPIQNFAAAAERIGRGHEVEEVDIKGPAEVQLAARAINDMQARLRRYVVERTSVVGAIAHDLRTPLSRLHFHLAGAPEEVRGRAETEIAEMEQMIAVTLDFVQNETRSHVHEPIELGLLVEGVVDDHADLGQDVTLEESAPLTVEGDPILLKRLFGNLIGNAVNYGRSARVRVRSEDGRAIVDIEDEGPGLKPADMLRAFEPFYRAEGSRNRSTGGMGLGLAIVKAAAERHGGTVELANRPEGGLRARVSLPTLG